MLTVCSLEQFEDWAVERLRVLRVLEKHSMGAKTKFSKEYVEAVSAELEKHGLKHYLQLGKVVSLFQIGLVNSCKFYLPGG
jgi:hypothetical protein